MSRTVKLVIGGRVQGVFFRKATKQKADELGVFGTVRNLNDGRVEIVAQTKAEIFDIFIRWCHDGPLMARVDKVEIFELEPEGKQFNSFEII